LNQSLIRRGHHDIRDSRNRPAASSRPSGIAIATECLAPGRDGTTKEPDAAGGWDLRAAWLSIDARRQ
jgi:hypothetical protein